MDLFNQLGLITCSLLIQFNTLLKYQLLRISDDLTIALDKQTIFDVIQLDFNIIFDFVLKKTTGTSKSVEKLSQNLRLDEIFVCTRKLRVVNQGCEVI